MAQSLPESKVKSDSPRPTLEVSSPKKGEANKAGPIIWAAYKDMRVAAETGAVGYLAESPDEDVVVSSDVASKSFDIEGVRRFGRTAAEVEMAIRNQKQRQNQMLVGWLKNGLPRVVGFAMVNNDGGERTLDHFSVYELGRRHSVGVKMVAKAVEFHEGNPFTAPVIASDHDALRQHTGLGFENTGVLVVHSIGDVEVPHIVMRHPGA